MSNWEHSLLISKEGLCFLLHQVSRPSRRANRGCAVGDQRAGPLAAVRSLGWWKACSHPAGGGEGFVELSDCQP